MRILILAAMLSLSGCATWNELSEGEKDAVKIGVVAGAILIGANIIKNSQGDTVVNNCISTRSLQTGCEGILP